ncbi:hypothetical protein SNEBB_002954 [Seison nebaliae]|nr:hypothetical protein SNEBB_002954 [Seison nebaliae]
MSGSITLQSTTAAEYNSKVLTNNWHQNREAYPKDTKDDDPKRTQNSTTYNRLSECKHIKFVGFETTYNSNFTNKLEGNKKKKNVQFSDNVLDSYLKNINESYSFCTKLNRQSLKFLPLREWKRLKEICQQYIIPKFNEKTNSRNYINCFNCVLYLNGDRGNSSGMMFGNNFPDSSSPSNNKEIQSQLGNSTNVKETAKENETNLTGAIDLQLNGHQNLLAENCSSINNNFKFIIFFSLLSLLMKRRIFH